MDYTGPMEEKMLRAGYIYKIQAVFFIKVVRKGMSTIGRAFMMEYTYVQQGKARIGEVWQKKCNY